MYLEHFLTLTAFCVLSTLGSPLHGPCESDADCGTMDTYCNKDICACKHNFAVWFDTCVPLANPRITCTKKQECQAILGAKSMCTKKMQCACKPFHHLHMGHCVKNRDLLDTCDNDHQCYCGVDCEDKIACIGKNCTCKPGNIAYRSRRCIAIEVSTNIPQVIQKDIQLIPIEVLTVNSSSFSDSSINYPTSMIFTLILVTLAIL